MKIPFASHIGTKLMALVLAAFIWGFSYHENLQKAEVPYTVKILVPPDLQAVYKENIKLTVQGPRNIVDALRGDAVRIIDKTITEEELEPYSDEDDELKLKVAITEDDLKNGQAGLTYENLPLTVEVKLMRTATVALPISLDFQGTPASGFVYSPENSYWRPRQVHVTGPKGLLKNAQAIYTEPIDIEGESRSLRNINQRLVSKIDGKPVRLQPELVNIGALSIVSKPGTATYEEVPVRVLASPEYTEALKTEPATVTVEVTGPAELVGNLNKEKDFEVFVRVDENAEPTSLGYNEKPRVWVSDVYRGKIQVKVLQEEITLKFEDEENPI